MGVVHRLILSWGSDGGGTGLATCTTRRSAALSGLVLADHAALDSDTACGKIAKVCDLKLLLCAILCNITVIYAAIPRILVIRPDCARIIGSSIL